MLLPPCAPSSVSPAPAVAALGGAGTLPRGGVRYLQESSRLSAALQASLEGVWRVADGMGNGKGRTAVHAAPAGLELHLGHQPRLTVAVCRAGSAGAEGTAATVLCTPGGWPVSRVTSGGQPKPLETGATACRDVGQRRIILLLLKQAQVLRQRQQARQCGASGNKLANCSPDRLTSPAKPVHAEAVVKVEVVLVTVKVKLFKLSVAWSAREGLAFLPPPGNSMANAACRVGGWTAFLAQQGSAQCGSVRNLHIATSRSR